MGTRPEMGAILKSGQYAVPPLKVRVDLGENLCTMISFDIFFLKKFKPFNGSKRAQSELRT